MATLDYRTAGESHGPALITLVDGMPAGTPIDAKLINSELRRRQGGHGRGGRMQIEQDKAILLAGVRKGVAMGSPIAIQIANYDSRLEEALPLHCPRPGHADLAGSLKWLTTDCRETLERASARGTAARVASGGVARCLLREFGIEVLGFVVRIGSVAATIPPDSSLDDLRSGRNANKAYCPDAAAATRMTEAIDQAKANKDTIGGVIEVRVEGHPPGLGSCARWQDKLDGRLMRAVGSIQAFKGVEIGLGFEAGEQHGSDVHDPIRFDAAQRDSANLGFVRSTNNAGGIEGGMSNGAPIIVRAAMKPISTLLRGLESVDLKTKTKQRSDYERSDICAVPAASVVAENVVAFEIARAFVEKFGGDTIMEVRASYDAFLTAARALGEGRDGGT